MLTKLTCWIGNYSAHLTTHTHSQLHVDALHTFTDPSKCLGHFLHTDHDDQVYNLTASLDCSKATGSDNISARMLKGTVSCMLSTLINLFNLSIRMGTFPQNWKWARVLFRQNLWYIARPSAPQKIIWYWHWSLYQEVDLQLRGVENNMLLLMEQSHQIS